LRQASRLSSRPGFSDILQRSCCPPEFQKLLDHRGVLQTFIAGSLAQLPLARSYTISDSQAAARKQYEAFFARWKVLTLTRPS